MSEWDRVAFRFGAGQVNLIQDPVIQQVVNAMQRAQSLPEGSPVRHALLALIPMIAGINQEPEHEAVALRWLRDDILAWISFT